MAPEIGERRFLERWSEPQPLPKDRGSQCASRSRSLHGLLPSALALAALPALSQNLLVNSGFDRDLAGWTAATTIFPSPSPGYVEASLGWTLSDANASALSGGAALHAKADTFSEAKAALTQCALVSEGMLVSFGAKS